MGLKSNMGKKIFFIILIAVGIFLRFYQINEIPSGLFMDEATIAVDSKSIAQNGFDEYGRSYPLAFEALSDFRPPGYVYLTSLAYEFLGPTTLTVRIVSLLSSILGIFILGYFTKLLFPKRELLPLISMAVLAISPFHIHFSRIGYETMLATTLMLVYFISLIHLLKKPNLIWIIVGILCAGLSIWTYPGAKFIVPIVALVIFLLGIFNINFEFKRKNMIIIPLIFLATAVLVYIPALLNPIFDKRPISYLKEGTDGTLLGIITKKPLLMLNSWLYMFDFQFLFKKGDLFAFRHGTKEQGLLLSIFAIPFILGILAVIRRYSSKSFGIPFLIILTLVIGFPSALTSGTPYGTRILPILIPFSIFVALGIEILVQKTEKLKPFIKFPMYLATIVVIFFQISLFYHIYFVHFKKTSLPEFPKASRDMAIFVKDFRNENKQTPVYFMTERSCRQWAHDDLHFWYFADLDNTEMVKWNNKFREERYKKGSPFDNYDVSTIPSHTFESIHLYPGYEAVEKSPKDSLIVRCGLHLDDIDESKEEIIKIFYMYQDEMRDPYYVITKKL